MPLVIQGALRPAIPAPFFEAFVRGALLAVAQHQGWQVNFAGAQPVNEIVATCTKTFLYVTLTVVAEFTWVSADAASTTVRVRQTLTVRSTRPLVNALVPSALVVRLLAQYNHAFKNGGPVAGTLASIAFLNALEHEYYTAMLLWIERWHHREDAIFLNSPAEFAPLPHAEGLRAVNVGFPRNVDDTWRDFRMIQPWSAPEAGGGMVSGAAIYQRDRRVWVTPMRFGGGGRGRGGAAAAPVLSRLRGTYQFVVYLDGRIQIGEKGHSAAYGGMEVERGSPVSFAGEADFREGVLQQWTNNSGHYRPNPAFAFQAGFPLALFRAVRRDPAPDLPDLLALRAQLVILLQTFGRIPPDIVAFVAQYLFLYCNRIRY